MGSIKYFEILRRIEFQKKNRYELFETLYYNCGVRIKTKAKKNLKFNTSVAIFNKKNLLPSNSRGLCRGKDEVKHPPPLLKKLQYAHNNRPRVISTNIYDGL